MKQKSRKLGDQISAFFHKVIKLRNARNTIRCLYDSAGAKVDEPHQLKDLAVDFFKNLLGPPVNVIFSEEDANKVSSLLQGRVSSRH